MTKKIHVLCDYDALFTAIELKLSCLSHVHVIRHETSPTKRPETEHPTGEFDLIIVAPAPPINDPMFMLFQTSLLNRVGQVPVLVISEQPSRPESDDKITYLNFPFDMDDLTHTTVELLNKRSQIAGQDLASSRD